VRIYICLIIHFIEIQLIQLIAKHIYACVQVDAHSEGGTGAVIGGSRGSVGATTNSSNSNSSGANSSATMSGNGGVDKRIRMFSLHGNAAAASMLLQVRPHYVLIALVMCSSASTLVRLYSAAHAA
jgi:hypothetical protein